MTETAGVPAYVPALKSFGDDVGDDVETYPRIEFEVTITESVTRAREVLRLEAAGMVTFRQLSLPDLLRTTVDAWFDNDVLIADDGIDELPDLPDPDEQADALRKVDVQALSSRAKWAYLWGDQDRYEIRGKWYGEIFDWIYAQYQDRHGIQRVPTEQSGRSSSSPGARTGSGSRARRR